MKCFNNKWIIILLIVCFVCLLANCVVVYCYRSVFGSCISREISDWNLFMIIFNGIITTVLAVVNICAIIKINSTLDNNSEKRHIKNMLFESQTILAKMRLDDYNLVKHLINEIKVSIFKKRLSSDMIEQLKKKLMEIDESILYKNQNLHATPFLHPVIKKLVEQINDFVNKVKLRNGIETKDEEDLLQTLSLFQNLMEFYIISQLARGSKVQQYISDNQNEMDCTISCMYDYARELNELLEEENKKNEE